MDDLISRQVAIDALKDMYHAAEKWRVEASDDSIKARAEYCMASIIEMKLRIENMPSAQPDARLNKIADLVDGTIDHFDRDDAMDLLYQIKEVLKDG